MHLNCTHFHTHNYKRYLRISSVFFFFTAKSPPKFYRNFKVMVLNFYKTMSQECMSLPLCCGCSQVKATAPHQLLVHLVVKHHAPVNVWIYHILSLTSAHEKRYQALHVLHAIEKGRLHT